VVPVGGLGTRLLSATKEQPKEMLPIFSAGEDGSMSLKPLVQTIFEQLFDSGIREFYFVVGRNKRAIEDHFTPDPEYLRHLNGQNKISQTLQLENFYRKIETSTILWVNQAEPKGFGHAVLQTQKLVVQETFLVHAGDTLIKSKNKAILTRLTEAYTACQAEAMLTLQELDNPQQYGVAETTEMSNFLNVKRVVEKPSKPASKLAIMPIYIFKPSIFEAIKATHPGKGGEIQLTDAIQRLIDAGHSVRATTG
jgi:UTP--glucose-1-phosphate uridylyltransferase